MPGTKSAHGGSQSAVPATRSAHGGSQSTAPATKSAHEGSQSAAPVTKSAHQAPVPSRRQGVHPTPWQAASAAHSAQMLRRCPADARAYIRPLGKQQAPHTVHMEVHKVLCLPRDLRTEVHKVQRLPRNLHMKVHKVLRLPRNLHIKRRCPADGRAYIRPLGKQQSPHTARKCYRQSAGAQPTPGRTSDPLASSKVLCLPRDLHMEVHKVLCLPRDLRMKVHKVRRLPRNLHIKRRCPADARAYIRPLGKQQSAVPATRSAHGGSQSTAPATKSAHEGSQSAAPATKSAHQAPVPSRRQGVHPTPRQAASAAHSAHGGSQSAVPATRSAHGG